MSQETVTSPVASPNAGNESSLRMGRLKRFFRMCDNLANPILVKEIRQAVKGRFLTIVLGLILLIQLFVWWWFSVQQVDGLTAYAGMLTIFGFTLGNLLNPLLYWRLGHRAWISMGIFIEAASMFLMLGPSYLLGIPRRIDFQIVNWRLSFEFYFLDPNLFVESI